MIQFDHLALAIAERRLYARFTHPRKATAQKIKPRFITLARQMMQFDQLASATAQRRLSTRFTHPVKPYALTEGYDPKDQIPLYNVGPPNDPI